MPRTHSARGSTPREHNTEHATGAPRAGPEPVVDAMDDAIFKLMHCGIEAAWHKFERR